MRVKNPFDNFTFEELYRGYLNWLQCAYNYYHEEHFKPVHNLSDIDWTYMGFALYKHIDNIQFLVNIDFTGNTLGLCTKEELLVEIQRVYNERKDVGFDDSETM